MTYQPRTFALPTLTGISEKQIKVHLALYEGYVKHVNLITEQIQKLKESGTDPYVVSELRRRLAFEFDGMRMHEYYFEQFEEGATAPNQNSALASAAAEKYGSGENFLAHITEVAGSRGIGWVVIYSDPRANSSTPLTAGTLHTVFVNDHELGQLAGLPIILALDLWEHSYMVDYVPAEKKNYIEAFLANVNWAVPEKRFATSMSAA